MKRNPGFLQELRRTSWTAGIGAIAALIVPWSAPADDPDDVARTWAVGEVYLEIADGTGGGFVVDGLLRADYIRARLAALSDGPPRAAAVLLHGCDYAPGDVGVATQARFLAKLGFVVFLPNSFARAYRPPTCDTVNYGGIPGAPYRLVHDMRRAELRHAIERVLEFSWVDRSRLIGWGWSQGSEAVLGVEHAALRARVAIGSACWQGVAGDAAIPTLIVTSLMDPWYHDRPDWPEAERGCHRLGIGERPSITLIEPEGTAHNPLIYREVRAAAAAFLRDLGLAD